MERTCHKGLNILASGLAGAFLFSGCIGSSQNNAAQQPAYIIPAPTQPKPFPSSYKPRNELYQLFRSSDMALPLFRTYKIADKGVELVVDLAIDSESMELKVTYPEFNTLAMKDNYDSVHIVSREKGPEKMPYFGGIDRITFKRENIPVSRLKSEDIKKFEDKFDSVASKLMEAYRANLESIIKSGIKLIE